MSVLDVHVRGTSPLCVRLCVAALLGLLASGVLVRAQAPAPAQPLTAEAPALPNVTIEVASIRRNKEAEAQRAAIPPGIPVTPGRAQTLPGGR